ncbi:MAG: transporter permease [Proteobacteria bacterium]|nr:transporter permease [Pseudomonadota bacterium]
MECLRDELDRPGFTYDSDLGIYIAYEVELMISLIADFRLAARNLRRNTRRTLVATLTVAFGIVAYMLAGGFIAWIFEQMREGTIHSQLGHIQIVRPGYFEKGIADPYAFLLPEQSSQQKTIEAIAGFQSLAPRLSFSGLISHGDTTIAFLGDGVDPVLERPVSTGVSIVTGRDLAGADQKAVLLGEGLARSLGVKAGDVVVLLATSASGGPSAVEVGVAGTFATDAKEYDDSALRLPIEVTRKLMKVSGATSWVVLLDKTERTAESANILAKTLPSADFEVVPWTALADFYNKTVVLFSKQVSVVKFIIGLIIVLTISNTQMMSVLERTTEIGTSLAIGQRRKAVLRMFVSEGVLIGFAGGVLGVVLGFILAGVISAIGIPMPPPPGMARGFVGQILVDRGLAFDALVLALVTTFLASVAPAWKASRMNIVDALRHNQ